MFESIKRYYNMGKYTDDQMKIFVQANWITEAEYNDITEIEYIA